jgi:hypothetical protein
VGEPRPCPRSGGTTLKALLVGLCTLVLVTQAAAATSGGKASHPQTHRKEQRALSLEARLQHTLAEARRLRGTIRFFTNHRTLLSARGDGPIARAALARAQRLLPTRTREAAYYRRQIGLRDARRVALLLAKAPPRLVIRSVFGRYAEQALAVAWCESRLLTTAHNGQYLGLFQMGSNERRLFGHGDTAHAQALAAHRYFVASGRDWSPWGCRWAASV